MEAELQGHEDGKLWGEEVPPVEPEHRLRPLYHRLELVALAVVQLGGQDETGPGAELPVHLVDDVLQNQLLKVNIGLKLWTYFTIHINSKMLYLRYCDGVYGALEPYPPHLHLDAPQLAQGDLGVGEPLAELLIQLLLHVWRLDVLDDAGLQHISPSIIVCTPEYIDR